MMRLIAMFLLLASSAIADQATLAWDHPSDTLQYRVYLDDAPLLTTAQKQAEITLPPAGGVLKVSAFSDQAESARSEPLVVPAAPTNITVTIIFGSP